MKKKLDEMHARNEEDHVYISLMTEANIDEMMYPNLYTTISEMAHVGNVYKGEGSGETKVVHSGETVKVNSGATAVLEEGEIEITSGRQ
ncbi:hypothetical protein QVD17_00321 [Tagetes erecta]|uniref:Uncharacterized protein n=1 Tax=Tagetes erecta TaxID=13708 RepID=A0AAD8L5K2_TARER|nr:hypothetical protein QVD17_00321 [Tagetes erecta]